MSSNDNWLLPSWNKFWDVRDNDGGSENGTSDDVSDCTVWRPPHLLEIKLCHTSFIGGDGCAFDSNFAGFDGFGGLNSDLVISSIAVFHAEIKVLDVQVQMRED